MEFNELSHAVIGAAMEVHQVLGPGLLEPSYQKALVHELGLRSIPCRAEVLLPLTYKGLVIDNAYRIDILADENLILELKAVEKILPVHKSQLLTYLRLADKTPRTPHQFQYPAVEGRRHSPHQSQAFNSINLSALTQRPLRLCVKNNETFPL